MAIAAQTHLYAYVSFKGQEVYINVYITVESPGHL